MLKSPMRGFIVVLVVSLVSTTAPSSYAEMVYSSFVGFEDITVTQYVNNDPVSTSTADNLAATLSMTFDTSTLNATLQFSTADPTYNFTGNAGAYGYDLTGQFFFVQQLTGAADAPYTYAIGSFEATYDSISPGGEIDSNGASVYAQLTGLNTFDSFTQDGTGTVISVTFQTPPPPPPPPVITPEPSTIVEAMSGLVLIALQRLGRLRRTRRHKS